MRGQQNDSGDAFSSQLDEIQHAKDELTRNQQQILPEQRGSSRHPGGQAQTQSVPTTRSIQDIQGQQPAPSSNNSSNRNIWNQQPVPTTSSSSGNNIESQQPSTSSSSSPRRNIWDQQGLFSPSTSLVNNTGSLQHLAYDSRGPRQAVGVQDRSGSTTIDRAPT